MRSSIVVPRDLLLLRVCTCSELLKRLGFEAFVDCISDPAYDELTVEQLVALVNKAGHHRFCFIADRTTFSNPERLVLVVDLNDEPGRTFRVIKRKMWSVENNLSIGNKDYYKFADDVDPDGVFRGFLRE